MVDSSKLNSLYENLRRYVKSLSDISFFWNGENSQDIGKLVLSIAPLFFWLAKVSNNTKEAEDIFVKFRREFEIDESEQLEVVDYSDRSEIEIKDEINYLKVCIQNICNVDLDSSLDELKELNSSLRKHPDIPDSLAVYRSFWNVNLDSTKNVGEFFDDIVVRSHAWDRLNRDIREGSVYIYETRPKRNVFIKYFLTFLYFIGFFVSMALFASLFFNHSTDIATKPFFLLSTFGLIYFLLSMINLKKTFGNENYKYSFQKRTFWYAFWIVLILTAFVVSDFKIASSSSTHTIESPLMFSLMGIVLVNFIVYLVSYLYLQPKKDKKLMQELLEKYMADISNSGGLSFK